MDADKGAEDRSAAGGQIMVGIDTGGTYTDAAVLEEQAEHDRPARLIAKAKRLTTPEDLSRGIGAALDAALADAAVSPERVALVSLSTTLATNALVEGVGGRAALVMIGFDPSDLGRQGLAEARGDAPLITLAGGHGPMGEERQPLDLQGLEAALVRTEAEAFAICSYFAVRNPAHELAAREAIRARTGCPVTCSHELSAKVGGPKRALTALLNARLIGLIDRLIGAAEALLTDRAIQAPLMVVRGDGALVSAAFARTRPIETILSGPAASLVGASWLTGAKEAIVSDIGGTTTDIATLSEGRPRLDPEGARVGGHRTMVEAVAMRTHGLGGDSEVSIEEAGLAVRIELGPKRVVPISLIAAAHPEQVHAALDRQLQRGLPGDLDARFVMRRHRDSPPGLSPAEAALLAAIGPVPQPADQVLKSRMQRSVLRRLIDRGVVTAAGFTPTDAAHLAGLHDAFDTEAARKAAALIARRSRGDGGRLAADPESFARKVIAQLHRRSAELILDAAFAEDGFSAPDPARSFLAAAALDGHAGLVRPRIAISVPVIGLGASAGTYYGTIAELLGAEAILPEDADVANAIGAVVGRVRIERRLTITVPAEGRFRVHLTEATRDCASFAEAEALARDTLRVLAETEARAAGAGEVEITLATETQSAEIEGREMIVEATVTARASGRPRLAEMAEDPPLPAGFTGV